MIFDHIEPFIAILLRLGGCRLATQQGSVPVTIGVNQDELAQCRSSNGRRNSAQTKSASEHVDLSYRQIRILEPDPAVHVGESNIKLTCRWALSKIVSSIAITVYRLWGRVRQKNACHGSRFRELWKRHVSWAIIKGSVNSLTLHGNSRLRRPTKCLHMEGGKIALDTDCDNDVRHHSGGSEPSGVSPWGRSTHRRTNPAMPGCTQSPRPPLRQKEGDAMCWKKNAHCLR